MMYTVVYDTVYDRWRPDTEIVTVDLGFLYKTFHLLKLKYFKIQYKIKILQTPIYYDLDKNLFIVQLNTQVKQARS